MSVKEPQFKKGQLLVVKAPPYYKKEYFYEIVSAGDKQIRATLFRSPRVKKNWSVDELKLLIEHGVIRMAREGEPPSTVAHEDS
jgi:hypothetical protein